MAVVSVSVYMERLEGRQEYGDLLVFGRLWCVPEKWVVLQGDITILKIARPAPNNR